MTLDNGGLAEACRAGLALVPHDPILWHCHFKVELRRGDWSRRDILKGLAPRPFEIVEHSGDDAVRRSVAAFT